MKKVRTGLSFVVCVLFIITAMPVWGAGVDMDFKDADIRDVLRVLGEVGGFNVVADKDVQGNVTFYLRDMDAREAIDLVVKSSGYGHTFVGETLVVGPKDRLTAQFEEVRTTFFPLRFADPQAMAPALEMVVQPASVRADTSGRGVLVRGSSDQLAAAEVFLRERDVRPPLELDFVETELVSILNTLARQGGYNLIASPSIDGRLTIFLRGMDVAEAMAFLARETGIGYRFEGNNLVVTAKADFGGGSGSGPTAALTGPEGSSPDGSGGGAAVAASAEEVRIFPLYHIQSQQARSLVTMIIPESQVRADEASRTLLARGSANELDRVASLLAQYDLPPVRADGVVILDGDRLAVLSIGSRSYVVREGMELHDVTVQSISEKEILLLTAGGQILRLTVGGGK